MQSIYKLCSDQGIYMKNPKNKKDCQLLIRIDGDLKDEFISLCNENDSSAAREVRFFIKNFIKNHDPCTKNASTVNQVPKNLR